MKDDFVTTRAVSAGARKRGQAPSRQRYCGTLARFAARSQSPFSVAILWLLVVPAAAQDTVTLVGPSGGRTKVIGRIVDYRGGRLQIEMFGGHRKEIPGEQVLEIDTQYGPEKIEADRLLAAGRFAEALDSYDRARRGESRRWVQRQITAQMVRCYRAIDRPDRAGNEFLGLILEDPNTPYFDCIPLAWMSRQPSPHLEQTARAWLLRDEPAAVLLGASHLLSTAARGDALRRLRNLTLGPDRRIAQLALAQTWRAEIATAGAERIDAWEPLVEKLPEPLAAGPYFVLGQARLRQRQWESAALAMLRVAILYPDQRGLAAEALLEAGRALERLDRTEEALRLYRELVKKYPEQERAVAEAEGRMNDE